MRFIKITLAIILAGLLMLGTATIITLAAQTTNKPSAKYLQSSPDVPLQIQVEQNASTATAVPRSKLAASHSFGGSTWNVTGKANHIYYNAGADLVIANTSNQNSPVVVSRWANPDKTIITDIYEKNNFLYVNQSFSGVNIVDISNLNDPVKVGNIPIQYFGPTTAIHNIEVSGNYAYVPQGKWLRVVDISTPSIPTDIAVITPTNNYLGNITLSGNYAYITAGSDGLLVVDISTPASPTLIGSLATPGYAQGIVKQGNYVYITESSAVQIIDVSTPNNPVPVGTYQPANFYPSLNMVIAGNYLYLQDIYGDELHIINVSNPSTPGQTSILPLPSAGFDLYLSGSTLYLGTHFNGLGIVNAANPASPVFLKTLEDMPYAASVALTDDAGVYVSAQHALWYLQPQELGLVNGVEIWDTPMYLGEMLIEGNLAYLTKSDDVFGAGNFEILDINNIHNPTTKGATSLGIIGAAYLAISNSYAYVGSWHGISAINISNPSSPSETSVVHMPSGINVRGLDVEGNYLYAATTDGLKIYNIGNPAILNFVGEYPGVYLSDVAVEGRYAYITGNSAQIIDVLTPSTPVFIRELSTCGVSDSVTLSQEYVYITDGCRDLKLYDVNDPVNGSNFSIASTSLPAQGEEIIVVGDEIFVAAGNGGFVKVERLDDISDFISVSGGSLTSPDGLTTIDVPANTYTNTVYLRYEETLPMETGSLESSGSFFTLSAIYTNTGQVASLPPGKSISITLDYTPSTIREDTLQVYSFDSNGNAWVSKPSTVDTNAQKVYAQLTSFTGNDTFALLGESYKVYLPSILR